MAGNEIVRAIFENFPYAFYASVLVGMVCAYLGVYIVARRVIFFGAVLTQVSMLGLAVSFLPFLALSHTTGSLAVTLIAVLILSQMLTGRKLPRDTVLGFVFVASIAARILILQKAPRVEAAEVDNLLRGDILFVTPSLFVTTAIASAIVMVLYLLFAKEFSYVALDPETARTQGYRANLWDAFFYLLAGVVVAFAVHVVGDIFVFGFLVAPPMAAMLLARKVRNIFLVAVLIGAISPMVGLYFAFVFDFPASPTSVGIASIVVIAAWLISLLRRR